MPYDNYGNFSIWDTHDAPVALDPIEQPEAPAFQTAFQPNFDGETAPGIPTPKAEHSDSRTVWLRERRELRLYVVANVIGQFLSAVDLKTALGRARSEHGQVDFISLVFRQSDYAAHSNASANLRGWLSRNGFRRIDSYNGRGILVEKDLTPKSEPQPPQPKLEVSMTPQAQAQRYREAGINIPPYLQRELALEKAKQEDAKNDPRRKLEECKARIAELKALKDSQK